jgi:hypothetical protein
MYSVVYMKIIIFVKEIRQLKREMVIAGDVLW